MKFLIYADPHWSSYSSILRSRGDKYSLRLENLIKTINWIESEARTQNCDAVVCLGDFFDKCDLTSEELTALQQIVWSDKLHYFIVGNHEMGRSNLEFSSTHLFTLCPNTHIVDRVSGFDLENNVTIAFLPYILENNREPLEKYLFQIPQHNDIIVMSHNDISGIQMGQYLSRDGFSIDEIENNCKLFINGHLHNGTTIGNKIINLGNITGQNFSEDAYQYQHQYMILDTTDQSISYKENPYALKFFKLDLSRKTERGDIEEVLNYLPPNSVITVKVNSDNCQLVKDCITEYSTILESRCIIDINNVTNSSTELVEENLSIDHIKKFCDYIVSEVGASDVIMEELNHLAGVSIEN